MKKRLTNNLALKLAALAFAFLLWLIVVNEIDPVERRTYSNVVVTMLHDELILNKGNTYRIVNGNTAPDLLLSFHAYWLQESFL